MSEPCDCAELRRRLDVLERELEAVRESAATLSNRDVPVLKGTLRAMLDGEIETIEDFPDAGRVFRRNLDRRVESVGQLEAWMARFGDVADENTTKEEKFAAVLAFAANKRNGSEHVALSAADIRGATGVSRRYAYDLMEAMAGDIDGVDVREPTRVQTGTGTKRKSKALLIDCEEVHWQADGVNQFTTGGGTDERV